MQALIRFCIFKGTLSGMEQRSSADVEWTEVDVESAGTLVSSKGYVLVDVR